MGALEELAISCTQTEGKNIPEACSSIQWNEWYNWHWNGAICSKTCGVGYQARWRIPPVTLGQNTSQLESEIRKCVINLAVDCKNPAAAQQLWTEEDTRRFIIHLLILALLYIVLMVLLRWQKTQIGNMWSRNNMQRLAPPEFGMPGLTPSQQIIHREMMKNLKLLHTALDAEQQQTNTEKLKEMEDLKANLKILGLA